jgi:hypothetical protein
MLWQERVIPGLAGRTVFELEDVVVLRMSPFALILWGGELCVSPSILDRLVQVASGYSTVRVDGSVLCDQSMFCA